MLGSEPKNLKLNILNAPHILLALLKGFVVAATINSWRVKTSNNYYLRQIYSNIPSNLV